MAQSEHMDITVKNKIIRLFVRRSGKARRYSLRVLPAGEIEAIVPKRGSLRAVEQIARANQDWLKKALEKAQQLKEQNPQRVWDGATTLPVFGQNIPFLFYPEKGRQKVFLKETDDGVKVYYGTKKSLDARLKKWYEVQALEYFSEEAKRQAKKINKKVYEVRIFNAKGRWGSCHKPTGRLAFHWKLALGPIEVAQYVVAHEVAHLAEANHSPKFWKVVERIDSDWKENRKWLKKKGHSLVL